IVSNKNHIDRAVRRRSLYRVETHGGHDMKTSIALALATALSGPAWAHGPDGPHRDGIPSDRGGQVEAAFDLVRTRVFKEGDRLVFEQLVDGAAGSRTPSPKGR